MGRRSTKTTKAGKFMNPTDQFSEQFLTIFLKFISCTETGKEQRKKELKKVNIPNRAHHCRYECIFNLCS